MGPRGACHIHIVVSGITLNLIRDVWIYGGMYIEPLRKDRNYRQLAEYFVKYSEKTRQTYGGKQAGRYNPQQEPDPCEDRAAPEEKEDLCRR